MSSDNTIDHIGLSSSDPLNATAVSLLGLLTRGPMSGWELFAGYERSIGQFWSLSRSQVYREIRTLAAGGYIEVGETGPRERRTCAITPLGRSTFRDWISAMPAEGIIRFPLLLAAFFGEATAPETLRTNFTAHRARHADRLVRYERQLPELIEKHPYPALSLKFGIAFERAVLEWIDDLPWMSTAPVPADTPVVPEARERNGRVQSGGRGRRSAAGRPE